MNVIGNGVDIVENKRIKNSLKISGFKQRIFSKNEIAKSIKYKNKISYFAKRFAAKEAFVKAIGTGFRKNINFKDITVNNDKNGKPMINLSNKLKNIKRVFKNKKYKIHLTLSDDKPWAVASVIVFSNK